MGMGGMNQPGMGPGYGGPGYGGPVMDTEDLAAAASFPECSVAWAELWPETGFTTSSRAGTATPGIPTQPLTSQAKRPLLMIPPVTPSWGATMTAAREPRGMIPVEAMQEAIGAEAMAEATGAAEEVIGAAEVMAAAGDFHAPGNRTWTVS